jgi:hypothetical protein
MPYLPPMNQKGNYIPKKSKVNYAYFNIIPLIQIFPMIYRLISKILNDFINKTDIKRITVLSPYITIFGKYIRFIKKNI